MNISRLTAALGGQSIRGGCEDCDAHQQLIAVEPGVYVITIHHDETCPFYQGLRRTS